MREKIDRLARENESLQKERLDHLNTKEEHTQKKDSIDQLLKEKAEMEKTIQTLKEDVRSLGNENKKMAEKLQDAEGIKKNVERQTTEMEGGIEDFQEECKEKGRQVDNMMIQTEKLAVALLERESRERELEDKVKILTEEVARLNERRTVQREQGLSELHGGTDAAKLQRIIDRQADQIKYLRKRLLETEQDRRLRELDFQEWEKTVHTVRKENSDLKVALEDLDRKKGLCTIFEEHNKVLEEQVKELKKEMVDIERKKEKEKRSILKETETLRTQMDEAFTARDVIRNEMESMALQVQKLEHENKDYKKDVAYFEEWFLKDYANHCEDLEDCLGKMFEVSDRHQLFLKEKLQLMRNTKDSDEI
ncbi:uncharacterized protein [Macrobrachium rosenbergii]|uniref:uncharacterized protein n=1 Tax=Macrobrachium rosenbergii TaxID=79674 RepID=UPI0034D4D0DC